MAKLIYSSIMSLDGYVADEEGSFDWGEPDEEVHSFINDLEREVRTYLYGRRLYEVMVAWETINTGEQPAYMRDFAEIWQRADKIVYSKTLEIVSTAKTRASETSIPKRFDRSKRTQDATSSSAVPNLLPTLSGQA